MFRNNIMEEIKTVFNGYFNEVNTTYDNDDGCKLRISCDNLNQLTKQIADRRNKIIIEYSYVNFKEYATEIQKINGFLGNKPDGEQKPNCEEKSDGEQKPDCEKIYVNVNNIDDLYAAHEEASKQIKTKKNTDNKKIIQKKIRNAIKEDFELQPHISVRYQKDNKINVKNVFKKRLPNLSLDATITHFTKEGKLRISYGPEGNEKTIDKEISRLCRENTTSKCKKNTPDDNNTQEK